jgi:hypothetical protein
MRITARRLRSGRVVASHATRLPPRPPCERAPQGGPHNHTISALATALKQSMSPEFKEYAKQVRRGVIGGGPPPACDAASPPTTQPPRHRCRRVTTPAGALQLQALRGGAAAPGLHARLGRHGQPPGTGGPAALGHRRLAGGARVRGAPARQAWRSGGGGAACCVLVEIGPATRAVCVVSLSHPPILRLTPRAPCAAAAGGGPRREQEHRARRQVGAGTVGHPHGLACSDVARAGRGGL